MGKKQQSLDSWFAERWPEKIVKQIGEIELTTCEWLKWEEQRPLVEMVIQGGKIHIGLRLHLSIPINKKIIAAIGGLGSIISAGVVYLRPYIEKLISG